jgi:4'-phosphopantetheinyl transferase
MFAFSSLPPLLPQSIHVWRVPLQVSPEILAHCQSLLLDDEYARMLRFHFPDDRRRFAVCRASLRSALLRYLDSPAPRDSPETTPLRFQYGPAGKPELQGGAAAWGAWGRGGELHFNVSHSADRALIAISHEFVGIDLEEFRALDYQAVATQVFSPGDLTTLSRTPAAQKPDTFFRLWVRHEARAKAFGAPIDGPQPEIPVYDLPIDPGFYAALATPIPDPQIQLLGDAQWTSLP